MIDRNNIIHLLGERSKANVYHSAILTCYNFDSIFFESVYLPTLRSQGITNVVVLMDASMYDKMLADSSYTYHKVSSVNYTLKRQENANKGVFHPKLTLLFGEKEGVLIVGSGNLTFSGLSNNDEVWNAFHVDGDESIHYPLLRQAWDYLCGITQGASSLVRKQFAWILEQSPWMKTEVKRSVVKLSSGEYCSLLFNTVEKGIFDALSDSIGSTKVEKITVVSPFYDTEGVALKKLSDTFVPNEMKCVLDMGRHSAPYSLLESKSNISFHKYYSKNPLHAKIIELQTNEGTWIMSGSANAGTKALGISQEVFNDESCILLHNPQKFNYIDELGLRFVRLEDEELSKIERTKQKEPTITTARVILKSAEEKDGKLYLQFGSSKEEGTLTILNDNQETIFQKEITIKNEIELDLEEKVISLGHIVVLKDGEKEISNRSLIIKERHVENCNPDSKRRELNNYLDDPALLENLSHIFGYIEFDDDEYRKPKSIRTPNTKSSKSSEEENKDVLWENFDDLKDSSISLRMHSGIRILTALQEILFKKEEKQISDDSLLEINEYGESDEVEDRMSGFNNQVEEHVRDVSEATQMGKDVFNFLKKMHTALLKRTADITIQGKRNPLVDHSPLNAVPGLNSASSIAVAARAVIVLMNKYGLVISSQDKEKIKSTLVKCAGLFFALYSNGISKLANDNVRDNKIKELLKDASVDLLLALSFFDFKKDDMYLPQVLLNCLNQWRDKEELLQIMPLYEKQLSQINENNLKKNTIRKIKNVATTFLKGKPQEHNYSRYDNVVFWHVKGFGYFVVDHIKKESEGWRFSYHYPWFDGNAYYKGRSKYIGYNRFDEC